VIKEYYKISKQILEAYPKTRKDNGASEFLNIASRMIFKDKQIDFHVFKVESFTRARRKVLEQNPHLDERTSKNTLAEQIVRAEMVA